MGIISRFFKIFQAKTNSMMDQIENTTEMVNQAIRDKEEQIGKAKESVQKCIAIERQSKVLLEKEIKNKKIWEEKAEMALSQGNEPLAIKALERSQEHENKISSLKNNWEQQRKSVDSLKEDILKMEDDLGKFKREKDFIIAQDQTADLKKQIYETKANLTQKNNSDQLMNRMREKSEKKSYEAMAAKEMADSFDNSDSLEKDFENFEQNALSEQVKGKLEKMKSKMNLKP